MANSQATEKNVPKIYTGGAIVIGTLLGGPLAAGYMIARNFKIFNAHHHIRKTWIYAILTAIVSITLMYLTAEDDFIPDYTIPLMYTAMAYYLLSHFQKETIDAYTSIHGAKFGLLNIVCVGVISIFVTGFCCTLILYILDALGLISIDNF